MHVSDDEVVRSHIDESLGCAGRDICQAAELRRVLETTRATTLVDQRQPQRTNQDGEEEEAEYSYSEEDEEDDDEDEDAAPEAAVRRASIAQMKALGSLRHEKEEFVEQGKAATKLQALRRGRKVRKDIQEGQAATKLQALRRGRAARKKIEPKRFVLAPATIPVCDPQTAFAPPAAPPLPIDATTVDRTALRSCNIGALCVPAPRVS